MFVIASWFTILTPWDRALGQLEFMFSPSYENREFFVWLVIANFFTAVVAVTFWFKLSTSYPFAFMLVCVSAALLVWAVWWSDLMFILSYALGLALSIGSWRRANPAFKRDAEKRGAP
ncbi:MAG: hypothetical protein B7Y56_15985 [Gallionellales bacterium 35-53-114]|nr:MAG: hypothetical protein B7Y56_15985 [Gallionellales bacterium 35-53-114]